MIENTSINFSKYLCILFYMIHQYWHENICFVFLIPLLFYKQIMIDKGKYASHGTFIKRLSKSAFVHWNKPKLAIIHPVPTAMPRQPQINEQLESINVQSKTFSAKFRFQENIDKKPVSQEFSQPFMYIEKVIKKQTLQKKLSEIKKYQPFVTTINPKKSGKGGNKTMETKPPEGFKNLYEYEQERRKMASKVFQKMLEAQVYNLKDMFMLWYGKGKKITPEIDVKQKQFIDFFKEILPNKLSQKQMRHFFELYKNKAPPGKQHEEQFRIISIKALSFNYEKYRKSQTEIINIMSQKAVKERYMSIKNYLMDFDSKYHLLKEAMNSIKNYEQSLRRHFKDLYDSYQNPFEDDIENLKRQLQKPIIKYDKFKKQQLTNKIEELTSKNQQMYSLLTGNYQRFIENYEQAIIVNHDLFFTKRTINKLLLPILNDYPYLTRQLVQKKVEEQQQKKQNYLQCLSDLVVQIDNDKKHLAQDCFTLDEIVQMILMKNKKSKSTPKFTDQFLLYSIKKLINEIKKQFLVKYQLSVQSIDQFPSDQEISLQLLHTCFEMECTKVLFKNQIWSELLNLIPQESDQKSKFHQRTIDSNICLEFVNRYFSKLDERIRIQMNKSKQISLLAQNVSRNDFQACASIIEGVINNLDGYVEDDDEQADKVQPLQTEKRKVTFADLADLAISKNNFPDKFKSEEMIKKEQEMQVVKSLIKSIFEESPSMKPENDKIQIKVTQAGKYVERQTQRQASMVQNLNDMNSLAKSFFVPEGLNTNSFDIRYYEKVKANQQKNRSNEPEVVRMGSSMLLSNLPHVEQIKSDDPLRISRFLMTNIDNGVKQQKKVVKQKHYDSNIRQGVSHNYYKDKIKLENKPTIYDSEGKSKYSVLLPVGYYESFVAAENISDQQKWYLRPHHVQTLTENPLSKKDNVIHTEYQSKLDKLPLKKRPDEYVIEENVKRKQDLISSLQERISSLRNDLEGAQRGSRGDGVKVSTSVVNNYLTKLTENKQDKELEIASYEGVLYDLRRKERELLVAFRQNESHFMGEPEQKWWERKDKLFNNQLRKDRLLQTDDLKPQHKHREYVQKLKNSEIY